MLSLKTVDKYVRNKGGVTQLTDEELIEVCLIKLSSVNYYQDGMGLLKHVQERDILFSTFFNLAKFSHQKKLPNVVSVTKEYHSAVKCIIEEIDTLSDERDFGANSGARQKTRLFGVLFALFYDVSSLEEVSREEVSELLKLVLEHHPKFCGEGRDEKLVRKDLHGILYFFEYLYKAIKEPVPKGLSNSIIPPNLAKSMDLVVAMRKSVNTHNATYKPYLVSKFNEYLDTVSLKSPKSHRSALKTLRAYIVECLGIEEVNNKDDLLIVLEKGRVGDKRYLHYLENTVKKQVKSKATITHDFLAHLMNEYNIKESDGYEPLFNTYEWNLVQRNKVYKSSANSKDETPKVVVPYRVHQIILDILDDPEYKWSKTLKSQHYINLNGKRVFDPTITNMIALMFHIPVRGIQAQLLDSGEGDEFTYDLDRKCWEKNVGQHACYWKAKGSTNASRGVIHLNYKSLQEEGAKEDPKGDLSHIQTAHLYINTNKTADINKAFGEDSGYCIEWHNDEVLQIISRQLKFLKKHHPVKEPASLRDLDKPSRVLGATPTKLALDRMPSRFYLFRTKLSSSNGLEDFPPTKAQLISFWNEMMIEVQNRLSEEGADYRVVSESKYEKYKSGIGGGNTYISDITMHCTRVTVITRLEEAGVPINILSKSVAGHKTTRMTYRYVKHDVEYVDNKITEAQAKISEKLQMSLSSDLRTAPASDAQEMIYMSSDLANHWEDVKQRAWSSNSLGICPNAATLCKEGLKDSDFEFKGAGRCLNCKYLMSGKAYLINIWNHVNKLMYRARELNKRYESLQVEYKSLIKLRKEEYKKNHQSDLWHQYSQALERAESQMMASSEEESMLLAEVYYGNQLFESVRNLTNTEDDVVEGMELEECSDFEHLHSIVESDSHLPNFERDSELKFKRDTFVDQALVALGEQPIFLQPLTNTEKEKALTAVSDAIVSDLKKKEGKFLGAVLKIEGATGGNLCLPS